MELGTFAGALAPSARRIFCTLCLVLVVLACGLSDAAYARIGEEHNKSEDRDKTIPHWTKLQHGDNLEPSSLCGGLQSHWSAATQSPIRILDRKSSAGEKLLDPQRSGRSGDKQTRRSQQGATTLDLYGHLIAGADEAAAKAIEGVLN